MFSGGTVNYWVVVNFSRQRQQAVDDFVDGIITMCIDRGMVFDRQLIQTRHAPSHNIEKALVHVDLQCLTELAQRALGKSQQLLIVILPDTTGSYGLVKRALETDLGIVSQCWGTNAILARPIPIITELPTIIFGADVTHPQPGEDSSSSIATVVASIDWPYSTKYRALMSAQPHRQEIIKDLYSSYVNAKKVTHMIVTVSYCYLVHGMCEKGRVDEGFRFYKEMRERELVPKGSTFMILICSLAMEGRNKEAIGVVFDMVGDSMSPNLLTYKTVVEGLCREGRVDDAFDVLEEFRMKDSFMNEKTYKSLLNGLHYAS
ncbi:argonaute/Dicer protein, PAZ [Tanacetum coccineum]